MLGGLTASQFTDTITKLFDAVVALPGVSQPGSLGASVPTSATAGLASASYAQMDTTNSLLLSLRDTTVSIRDWLKGVPGASAAGAGGSGPLTLTIGQVGPVYVDAAAPQPTMASMGGYLNVAVMAAIDQGLAQIRLKQRQAAGAPMGR
jgi:hypothetical protein